MEQDGATQLTRSTSAFRYEFIPDGFDGHQGRFLLQSSTIAMLLKSTFSSPGDQLTEYVGKQLPLFDVAPFISPAPLAAVGSQRWIQVAVEYAPEILLEALRPVIGLDRDFTICWRSPRAADGFREYRDRAALQQLGINSLPRRRLDCFWPLSGPVWDALGKTSTGEYLFLEAKAHIGEIFSPPTQARFRSRQMIEQSLREAQQYYCADSHADWSGVGYQYANRIAFHYLFRTLNCLPSHMVFLYFINAGSIPMPVWENHLIDGQSALARPRLAWTQGPISPTQWKPSLTRLHSRLGLPDEFEPIGVHSVFLDVAVLRHLTKIPLFDEKLLHEQISDKEMIRRDI